MGFLGNESIFADAEDALQQMEQKAAAVAKVTEVRNQIIAQHAGTPLKIAVAAVVWGWLVYRVLIRR